MHHFQWWMLHSCKPRKLSQNGFGVLQPLVLPGLLALCVWAFLEEGRAGQTPHWLSSSCFRFSSSDFCFPSWIHLPSRPQTQLLCVYRLILCWKPYGSSRSQRSILGGNYFSAFCLWILSFRAMNEIILVYMGISFQELQFTCFRCSAGTSGPHWNLQETLDYLETCMWAVWWAVCSE